MKVKEANKFMSLDKLLEIQGDYYRGSNGQEYDSDTVDSMIWQKQSSNDEENVLQALKNLDKLQIITIGR